MIPFLSAEHTLDKINVYVHTVLMVRVVDDGRFSVYVYDEYGVPHHQPHCQVRWASGDAQVALPSAHRLLEENQDKICGKWDELNPRRTIG